MHKNNPEIIELAKLMGRTPSSVGMRLGNFASVDPYHQKRGVVGLKGGMNQVKPIWDEFNENRSELISLSEEIRATKENTTVEEKYKNILNDIKDLKGEVKERFIKSRVNQSFFRQMVLANYSNECAVTGIDIPELLLAGHIIPWSQNEKERLNPENGICFSPLYDKAFENGLIGINTDYKIILSTTLKQNTSKSYYEQNFRNIEGRTIIQPQSYLPNKSFLEWHLDTSFNKSK